MARDRASRPEAKPLRLFVAVDVPPAIRAGLGAWIDPYRSRVPGARWTRSDSWHVTLKFLGSTWPRLLGEVSAAVEEAASGSSPFESALTEVGAFPSARRSRVLWVGLADPGERMARMARNLDERLREQFRVEKRPLTPHLTLARLRVPGNLEDAAPGLVGASVASERFPVDRLVLYRSHLSPRGARYEPLHVAPLGGGGPAVEDPGA